MSRNVKSIAAVMAALTLGAALSGCSLLPKEEESLQPPLVKPAQENYRTEKAEKGTIVQEIKGTGLFESIETDVAEFSGQGGRIEKILVAAGDKVKKGDALVQLLLDGLDLQLKEQELSLERAKYAYSHVPEGDKEQKRLAGLQKGIEQLKYDRLKKQFDSKVLRANIDGEVVFTEDLKEGDYVGAYQALVIVADTTKLRLALRFERGDDIGNVDVGILAEVRFNDKKLEAKVVQTPSSAPATKDEALAQKYKTTLYITVPNLPKEATIGTQADVRIIMQKKDNVVKIPRSAVRSYLGRNFVRVLEDGNRVREIDIETGITGSTEVEISKGLDEGALVVLQ